MVELFNHNQRVAVVAVKHLFEYSTNINKISGAQLDLLKIKNIRLPKKKKVMMPEFGVGHPVGLVVWVRLDGFPWWPAVIVDRKEHEKNITTEAQKKLPVEANNNRTVELFNYSQRVAVLQLKRLVEYSSHINKVSGADAHRNSVHHACYEAHAYIASKGLPGQLDLLQVMNCSLLNKTGIVPQFGI